MAYADRGRRARKARAHSQHAAPPTAFQPPANGCQPTETSTQTCVLLCTFSFWLLIQWLAPGLRAGPWPLGALVVVVGFLLFVAYDSSDDQAAGGQPQHAEEEDPLKWRPPTSSNRGGSSGFNGTKKGNTRNDSSGGNTNRGSSGSSANGHGGGGYQHGQGTGQGSTGSRSSFGDGVRLKELQVAGATGAIARILKARDYYAVLDVPREAEGTQIKKAYRMKQMATHPDKNMGVPGALEASQRVNLAYAALSG